METNNVWTVLVTAITILGGTTAFRYYEQRAQRRERDEDFIRHDCKDRIAKLEALLEESSEEKNELRSLIIQLTAEVAELRIKVDYLTIENAKLEKALKIPK
jgi:predicted RNase H-like nuclease (RuvC/YqgF family)